MAVSGLVLFGFIVGHLLGNLQVFIGQDAINRYSEFLKSTGELLWAARLFLLAMIGVHIWTSVQLTIENNAARPASYVSKKYVKASLSSRTMIWSGVVILAFVIYHLLEFTFIKVHPEWGNQVDAKGRHDVYSMLVRSFQQPLISFFYVLSVFLLCFHLSHGISSALQSLGLHNKTTRSILSIWGPRVAWLIFAGYASIPLAVQVGFVKLPGGVLMP